MTSLVVSKLTVGTQLALSPYVAKLAFFWTMSGKVLSRRGLEMEPSE